MGVVRLWRTPFFSVYGTANSIRKVATQLGISLAKVGRAILNLPKP